MNKGTPSAFRSPPCVFRTLSKDMKKNLTWKYDKIPDVDPSLEPGIGFHVSRVNIEIPRHLHVRENRNANVLLT